MDALLYKTDCLLIREEFEIVSGHQPQNALMMIQEGSFSCTFSGGCTFLAGPGDFLFFPMKCSFVRHVTEPCKFHLIYFTLTEEHPLCSRLPAGKGSYIHHILYRIPAKNTRVITTKVSGFSTCFL